MTATHKADLQKKFRYHHGNLREAAIAAALEILARDGVPGLSLRALAKATGVTPTAFYESHFGDKDELLAAVAETGFQRLALQMAEDATGAPSTQERIERLAVSYIRFATENKPLFQLMFGRELSDMKRFPTLAMTAGKSYSLISAALSKRTDGAEDAPEAGHCGIRKTSCALRVAQFPQVAAPARRANQCAAKCPLNPLPPWQGGSATGAPQPVVR